MKTNSDRSRRLFLLGTILLIAGAPGCAPKCRVCLQQPAVQGRQRQLDLASAQAFRSDDGKTERLLVEFPLPGASSGKPMFVLYLRVSPPPAHPGKSKNAVIVQVRGFLIQLRGQYAGRVDISDGTVHAQRTTTGGDERTLELTLEDGSSISGKLLPTRNDRRLKVFETEERPADVGSFTSHH